MQRKSAKPELLPTSGKWQGRLDSNQRMAGSKPAALPLGDAPVSCLDAVASASQDRLCRLRCSNERLLPLATNPGREAGSWAATLSASTLLGKLPNTQPPVPVNLAETKLFSKIKALRTSG